MGLEGLFIDVKVGELGCSSGPNAFFTAQNIIQSFDKHHQMNINHCEIPTIQYFMIDLVSNAFNLLFKGLPEFYEKMAKETDCNGRCIIATMPGTFYIKLFPDRSMHFFHSSSSLHWLSQAPKGLETEEGISMSKQSIHCSRTSPPVVQKAYVDQFRHDFSFFSRMCSRELVPQGQLLLTFLCKNSEEDDDQKYLHIIASTLSDMVTEGGIEEEKLEHFNLHMYAASVGEIKKIIKEERSFKILKFHSFKIHMDAGYEFSANNFGNTHDDPVLGRARYVATYFRAAFGQVLAAHFGEAAMDDLFHRYADKYMDIVLHSGQPLYLNKAIISLKKAGVLAKSNS